MVILLLATLVFVSTGLFMGFFDIFGVTDATVEISSLPNHAWDAASGSNPADSIPAPSSVAGRAVASFILFFLKAVNWVL
jgi:hypothetical protein